jgi:hypothetical protein
LHPPCAGGRDSQVGAFLLFGNSEQASEGYPRIYAVSLRNICSVVGLAIIAAAEFVFGVTLTIYAAKARGNAQPLASEEPLSPGACSFYCNYACIAQTSDLASISLINVMVCSFVLNRTLLIMCSRISILYGA